MKVNWTAIILIILVFIIIIIIVLSYGGILIKSALIARDASAAAADVAKQIDYDVTNIVTHMENSLSNSDVSGIVDDFTTGLNNSIPQVYKSESIIIKDIVKEKFGITIDENICSLGILLGDSMLSLSNTDNGLVEINTNLENIKEKVCN